MTKLLVPALFAPVVAAVSISGLAAEEVKGRGIVNSIDAAAGVVTMKHEAIPALK